MEEQTCSGDPHAEVRGDRFCHSVLVLSDLLNDPVESVQQLGKR